MIRAGIIADGVMHLAGILSEISKLAFLASAGRFSPLGPRGMFYRRGNL